MRPPTAGGALVLTLATALALAATAQAHVTVVPGVVEEDTTAPLTLEMPNEREGHESVQLTVDLPPQVRAVSVPAPAGWVVRRSGARITWSGGRVGGTATARFPLRVHAIGPAGGLLLLSEQRYEDGEVVRWQTNLAVTPATGAAAPPSHLRRALVASGVGLAVIVASLLLLHHARRRSRPTP